jgi:hypothetical protein
MVKNAVVHEGGLYFLIAARGNQPRNLIVHTDLVGAVRKVVPLPSEQASDRPTSIMDMAVDPAGKFLLLQSAQSQGQPRRFELVSKDVSSNLAVVAFDRAALSLCVRGQTVWLLLNDKSLQKLTGQDLRNAFPLLVSTLHETVDAAPMARPLPDSILILDRVLAQLHFVDEASGRRRVVSLSQIPEVQEGLLHYPPEMRGRAAQGNTFARAMPTNYVATTVEGDIYVNVSGHHVSKGAVILRLNSKGQLVERLYCALPRVEKRVNDSNPLGYMSPIVSIGAGHGRVFVIGAAGEVVWY